MICLDNDTFRLWNKISDHSIHLQMYLIPYSTRMYLNLFPVTRTILKIQKEGSSAEVRPSWIRKLQQKQEGAQLKNHKGAEVKQENKEKGRQEMKKKAQSNVTAKNKPASAKDNGTKKAANTKEEPEEKEKVVQEKAIDGESAIQSLDITMK